MIAALPGGLIEPVGAVLPVVTVTLPVLTGLVPGVPPAVLFVPAGTVLSLILLGLVAAVLLMAAVLLPLVLPRLAAALPLPVAVGTVTGPTVNACGKTGRTDVVVIGSGPVVMVAWPDFSWPFPTFGLICICLVSGAICGFAPALSKLTLTSCLPGPENGTLVNMSERFCWGSNAPTVLVSIGVPSTNKVALTLVIARVAGLAIERITDVVCPSVRI